MKKIILGLACLSLFNLSIAQEDQTDSQRRLDDFTAVKKHEVSLDVLAGLAIPALNPRYEYVLGRYSGVGADIFISLQEDDSDLEYYEKFSFNPYYRQYFFSKEDYGAKGFYAEGFTKFYTYEENDNDFFDINNNRITVGGKTYFETAIGVGVGWKWVSDSGFLIDIGFGLGRDLGFADKEYNGDFYYEKSNVQFRGGVNFGWRF